MTDTGLLVSVLFRGTYKFIEFKIVHSMVRLITCKPPVSNDLKNVCKPNGHNICLTQIFLKHALYS